MARAEHVHNQYILPLDLSVLFCVWSGLQREELKHVGSIKVWTPTKKLTGEASKCNLVWSQGGYCSYCDHRASSYCHPQNF